MFLPRGSRLVRWVCLNECITTQGADRAEITAKPQRSRCRRVLCQLFHCSNDHDLSILDVCPKTY